MKYIFTKIELWGYYMIGILSMVLVMWVMMINKPQFSLLMKGMHSPNV